MWGTSEGYDDIRGWRESRSKIKKNLKELQNKGSQNQKLIDLGLLVMEAEISEFNPDLLLGAFLEIRDILKDPERSKEASSSWSKKGKAILEDRS